MDFKLVNDVVIIKYRFGKEIDKCVKVSLYDFRVLVDRKVNLEVLS